MQAASSSYPLPPPPFYYHLHPIGPQDHDLKRQYLTLLPPQQIIEICLSFDIHVPPYIRGAIWPPDINAAIENLRKATPALNGSDKPQEEAPMDSLQKPTESDSNSRPDASSATLQTTEPRLPEKQPEITSATTAPPAATPTSPPTIVPPTNPPVQQQPSYPHQPYGYSQHPPAAYPHAPYYPPPPGYSSYPPYPPAPNGYHHPPPPPPPSNTGYPQPPNPMYPPAHASQPPTHLDQGSDDLPSYEEMIVEALQESTDPEGCAPKDLFTWMAARYPVQSNFRPSASQALQKAFKRGRFEKSNNGKYRLNATWEGGNTSRRTTRRPQTHSQSQTSALVPPSASPFTHAPLVHHHHPGPAQQNLHPQAYPGQPYPYPYGGPVPPGYPGYPPPHPQSQTPAQQQQNLSEVSAPVKPTSGDLNSDADRDAYEAAQNILKAINFGDLFKMAQEEENGKKADAVSVDQLTSLLVQAQSGLLQSDGPQPVTVPLQATGNADSFHPAPGTLPLTSEGAPSSPNVRAELQAQLVLLAAQLADLGKENEDIITPPVTQPIAPVYDPQELQQQLSAPSTAADPPLMDSLPPPPESSVSQPTANSQPSIHQQAHQSEVTPVDPDSATQTSSASTQAIEATQQPIAASPPPSSVSPAVDSLTVPPHDPAEEEDDSDDEDMEEII